jgi:hypothetical protein
MLSLVGEKLQRAVEGAEYALKRVQPKQDLRWRESLQGADQEPARPLHAVFQLPLLRFQVLH